MLSARKLMASPALLPPIPLPCRSCPPEGRLQYQFHAVLKLDVVAKNVLPRISALLYLARVFNALRHQILQIGIDVEEKQRELRNNILLFARRYFSPHEVDYLQAFSDPEIQRQEFIKLWTLKEAYVKAIGRGFSAAPFSSFTLRFRAGKRMKNPGETSSNTSQIILEASDDPQNLTTNWQFALFELASSHYASICVKQENNLKGNESSLLRLKVWKTVPFVDDTLVSGTDAVNSSDVKEATRDGEPTVEMTLSGIGLFLTWTQDHYDSLAIVVRAA
ncbi:hypothetical protein ACLOJK_005827 [Asimina triloba]